MSESSTDIGPGDKMVGITGIVSMMIYLALLFSILTYVMVKVWPHCQPGQPDGSVAKATPTPTPSPKTDQQPSQTTGQQASQAGGQQPNQATGQQASRTGGQQPNQAAGQQPPPKPDETKTDQTQKAMCPNPDEVTFFWGATWIWWEVRLILIVMLSGAIGALLHALRSMYWYVGNRLLRWSWLAMYILLPFCGGALGLVFYFVIRGGFFSPQGQAGAANPFGFAAISALIGMFSQQAVLKLKEVAETLLTKPKPGDDAKPQGSTPVTPSPLDKPSGTTTAIGQIIPNVGTKAGGEIVEINGSGFVPGVKVAFGGIDATVSAAQAAMITVTTPPHAAGTVDVIVTNPDGSLGKLASGFTYL